METNSSVTLPAQDPLHEFVEKLVEQKKFQDIEGEVMAQIKQDVYDRVEDRMNAVVLANLPPEHLEEFDSLLEKGDKEGMQSLCQKYIPNLESLMAEELTDFAKTYLNQ